MSDVKFIRKNAVLPRLAQTSETQSRMARKNIPAFMVPVASLPMHGPAMPELWQPIFGLKGAVAGLRSHVVRNGAKTVGRLLLK